MESRKAIIIGAGPAGLALAYELVTKSDIVPYLFDSSENIGGISRTEEYKGFRFDIGPHRFFSKSKRVMDFWQQIMPLGETEDFSSEKPALVRKQRQTRIYYIKKFFSYPISLSVETLSRLGAIRVIKILASYIIVKLFPRKEEGTLEDFLINRFGKELYGTFFRDYTAKIWGRSCRKISKDWGSQRIKGLSILKALKQAFNNWLGKKSGVNETSLIDHFYYPKMGAGQMYQEIARIIEEKGGKIFLGKKAIELNLSNGQAVSIKVKRKDNAVEEIKGEYFISTMPIKNLIKAIGDSVPAPVKEVANGLVYRDYIIAALIYKKNTHKELKDNWIYIQEKDVKIARLDLFNNFSPFMSANNTEAIVGAEYYCDENDDFWNKSDEQISQFAASELDLMGFFTSTDLVDYKIVRQPKAYPAYFGSYDKINIIKNYLLEFGNLYLAGRNGLHKYNNMDHSILTGLMAADGIIHNKNNMADIWKINTEGDYHENK